MPFRRRGISRRFSHLLLPAITIVLLLGIATWVLFALWITPHGWGGLTAAARLGLIGFAGVPVVIMLVGWTNAALGEDCIYSARVLIQNDVGSLRDEVRTLRSEVQRWLPEVDEVE